MKNKYALTFFLLWGVFSTSVAIAQETVMLSLDESIRYALENNVDTKNAHLEVMTSKAIISENLSRGLPQINGTFDFTHNMAIPIVFLPNEGPFAQPEVESDVIPARFGVPFQSSLGVRVEQMIFDGSFFVGLRAAKTLRVLTDYDREKAEIDVIENIKKAYFTVLINDERRALVEANYTRVETLLNETQALFNEGFAEKLDVSRVKVQLNNIRAELDRINAATAISVELLKIQMGLPLATTIQISENIREFKTDDDIQYLLTSQGERRIEIDQLNTNMELVNLEKKNQQVLYIPQINGFFTYQRSGAALDFGSTFNSNNWFTAAFVGVNMNIPIFDGFAKRSRIQQSRVQLRQLENQKSFLLDNIEVEKMQARINLQNSLKTLNVQEENRALALEVFQMTQIKYTEGVGSNFEVVEADSALKEAENNYFGALFDALIAKVDLEKALGILK